MKDLQTIRVDNAVKFTAALEPTFGGMCGDYAVRDSMRNLIACCCHENEAQVIVALLNKYSQTCAAKNVPLWDNALSRREAISARMEAEDNAALENRAAELWPKDPGYEHWLVHMERFNATK